VSEQGKPHGGAAGVVETLEEHASVGALGSKQLLAQPPSSRLVPESVMFDE